MYVIVERAFLAGVYASGVNDPNGAYATLAENTMNYILGSNPRNSSYLVGYGNNFPQQPHSRQLLPPWIFHIPVQVQACSVEKNLS